MPIRQKRTAKGGRVCDSEGIQSPLRSCRTDNGQCKRRTVRQRAGIGIPVQRRRRGLPEQTPVGDRKLSQLPKAVISGNRGYAGSSRVGSRQSLAGEVHSPQPKIADGSHAKLFLATETQRALGDTDRGADFPEVER